MTPFYADDWLTIYSGDCRDVLRQLASDSVDCVVTSPPYWGLRDYGTDGQLGLERTPEEYVANMVEVFREVRRVLKPSGTCWLNLGDSYNGSSGRVGPTPGLKPKQLVGIPWRVAFALQADGWYLRRDVIWNKPNPMPESVTDRPTSSHEYLFLLTKSSRYFFDSDAVREADKGAWNSAKGFSPNGRRARLGVGTAGGEQWNGTGTHEDRMQSGRNIRSVWNIATRPYPGAHFAVFPPELPERCIKAGSSERGVCPECGKPWERIVERSAVDGRRDYGGEAPGGGRLDIGIWRGRAGTSTFATVGWAPTCEHAADAEPATVLDPFAGSGTTGMVANRLSRRAILVDLNPEYLKQQMKRNAQTPLGLEVHGLVAGESSGGSE